MRKTLDTPRVGRFYQCYDQFQERSGIWRNEPSTSVFVVRALPNDRYECVVNYAATTTTMTFLGLVFQDERGAIYLEPVDVTSDYEWHLFGQNGKPYRQAKP